MSQPRTFVRDGEDGWTEVGSVDSETVQAFLAGANGAHDEARFFHDIAARNNPSLPESERLSTMDDVALKHLYDNGSLDDRFAAVYESARRGGPGVGGLSARWTQVKAIRALVNRRDRRPEDRGRQDPGVPGRGRGPGQGRRPGGALLHLP